MARHVVSRLAGRPAAFAGLAVSLCAPMVLGAMLVHVGGFYPDTALSVALRTGGLVLASLPVMVLVVEARARRLRDRGEHLSNAGPSARREWR